MSTLVECVPNFSEGRDKGKVDAIVAAMKVDGVYLLDREMDADHNRCVITLVGEREAIQEAAIRGVGKAAELIDLNLHKGAHPRMGAADVVPFIPIDGVTIEDCVAMARHVGEEIWKRFAISAPTWRAIATQSSIVTPSIGMKGTTSAAPMRGCAPSCFVRSINSAALPTPRMAAS